jgi:hypothetical protein
MKKLYYYFYYSRPLFLPTTNSVEFHKSKSFEETTSITITISGSTVDEAAWELRIILYLWAWSYDTNDANSRDCPSNGSWTVLMK